MAHINSMAVPNSTTAKPKAIQPAKQKSTQTQPTSNDSFDPMQGSEEPQVVINMPSTVKDEGVADILNGLAAVLWPLVIALVVILFRNQIVSLAKRIRKGKAFGAEAEFEKEVKALNREATKAKRETGTSEETDNSSEYDNPQTEKLEAIVMAEAARSPRLAIMLLSAEIDKLARRIAASTGHLERKSLRQQLEIWNRHFPLHTSAAYRLFSHVRNRIVHGAEASEKEILSSIDSGILLYDALCSVPIEENVVFHPGVEIYSDQQATQKSEGKGLIIETTHNGKTKMRIYPTTRDNYEKDMRLSWEWNMDRQWGPTWYKDPEDGEIKQAWSSSAEFVGRNLDEV